MSLTLADRVQETTTTTGTGTITLAGAVAQCQSFASGIGSGNTTYYTLLSGDGASWEVGLGTVGGSGPYTLARTTVLDGSSGTSPISLTGTSVVFCDLPAKAVPVETPLFFSSTSQSVLNGHYTVFPSQAIPAPAGSAFAVSGSVQLGTTDDSGVAIYSGSNSNAGFLVALQNDGNIVTYNSSGSAIHAAGSGGAPPENSCMPYHFTFGIGTGGYVIIQTPLQMSSDTDDLVGTLVVGVVAQAYSDINKFFIKQLY